jgi:hypothetical protein
MSADRPTADKILAEAVETLARNQRFKRQSTAILRRVRTTAKTIQARVQGLLSHTETRVEPTEATQAHQDRC